MRPDRSVRLILLVVLIFCSPLSFAGGHNNVPGWYGSFTLGWHDWSDAGDIEVDPIFTTPFDSGEFDSDGFNFEVSLHREFSPGSRWYWGGNLGFLSNDSDARGFVRFEELQLGMLYITPSLKFVVRDTPEQRIYFDFGAGYYAASIEEFDNYCYYYYCGGSTEYWDDDAFGGFIGLSADFDIGQPGGNYFLLGIKVHDVEFDAPLEVGSSDDLGGPITQIQIGFGFGG